MSGQRALFYDKTRFYLKQIVGVDDKIAFIKSLIIHKHTFREYINVDHMTKTS